ncbi:hypothetical protein [Komagataeibacter oboediens]|uniref:hypothetical protein n=1 Tax=Komagataeibacter oboediens TaxID=65958 RepID=UPI000237EA83|nr:hypothetical protein [Komagataeibacter oboediens]
MAPPAFGHGVIACAAKTRVVFNPSSVMAGEGAARPYCRGGTFRIDGYAIRFPVDGEHRRGSVRSCAACAPTPWRGRKKPVSVCRACMMHAGWRKSCLLASCRFGHASKAAGLGVVHHGWEAWRNESIPARGACVYPADARPVR